MEKNNKKIWILVLACVFILALFAIAIFKEKYRIYDLNPQINAIMNFINRKYGDHGFKVLEIKKDYRSDSIFNTYQNGYDITMYSDELKSTFTFSDGSNSRLTVNHLYDDFVEKYYEKKINEFLSSKYNASFSSLTAPMKIPNDFGHIPIFDELHKYDAMSLEIIVFDPEHSYTLESYIVDADIDYIIKITKDLVALLDINEPFDIRFDGPTRNNYYTYFLKYSKGAIEINYNKKIYTFNVNE